MEYLNIFIRSVFIENMIFAYFLGMCSYLAVSKNVKTAFGLGAAVTFVLVVTVPVNYLLQVYVLEPGALSWLGEDFADVDLSFLSFIMFIAVIASIVQILEMAIERYSPQLYGALGIFLPLIAVNCAILGASLFMQTKDFADTGQAAVYALGSGIGWLIAIVERRHKGKDTLFQHPQTFARSGYSVYRHRTYGDRLYELYGYKTFLKTVRYYEEYRDNNPRGWRIFSGHADIGVVAPVGQEKTGARRTGENKDKRRPHP